MTRLELFILKRILKKEVRQSFDHDAKITNLYTLIREAVTTEFTEDNVYTTDSYLRELFESTQYVSNTHIGT